MKLIYLGYWGANDGLSQATINPHLEILCGISEVSEIYYISVERNGEKHYDLPHNTKICHIPFTSYNLQFRFLTKILDFVRLLVHIHRLIKRKKAYFLLCRTTLAGIMGYLLHKLTRIPYLVESFEPHSDYMVEIGEWPINGLSHKLLSYFERKQLRSAAMILPVTNRYANRLVQLGYDSTKIKVAVCATDVVKFRFNEVERTSVRTDLRIDEKALVGIYIGKFGGIYLKEEAYELFRLLFEKNKDFFLIILSPNVNTQELDQFELPFNRIWANSVPFQDVPKYLSASDFGISLPKPKPSMRYINPIKNGEYWANGLPILTTMDIGDDSEILSEAPYGGVQFELNHKSMKEAVSEIRMKTNNREKIAGLAKKHRSFETIRESYYHLFSKSSN